MEENPTEPRPLDVLILAAGLGTRMRSNHAKVLHKADGRPLINHVCRTAAELSPDKIYIVIGHQAEEVREAVLAQFDKNDVVFVEQKQQLGSILRAAIRRSSCFRAMCRLSGRKH
jgi:bifunctional N-acetylglucosamine-1-phosphate-uridyltransferase/glucosamine-1-phosphate-acetyltransferase GlmU-like protein